MNETSRLIERLGQLNAERLVALAGGTRLYIPGQLTGSKLRARFGDELFALLVFNFGCSQIYVPRFAQSAPVDIRAVDRLTRKGWSASRIAKHVGCSVRTIFKKRAQIRAAQSSKGTTT